jgi:ring-1,2-phenylacetyl-CoA epoxidase subunit PaaE
MAVAVSKPVRRRPVFHALPVGALDRLTEDSLAITFTVPPELRETFAFRAGQHLTVRRVDLDGGEDVRRSYSICSTPGELAAAGILRIGVKEIPGGAFSAYAARALRAGDTVDVLPPLGAFTSAFDPARARRYGAIVAGSGITPVLSIAATALATEPASTVTIVYGNRYARSVMFGEELGDLKDRYPSRLRVLHVLSREPQDAELLSGRLDGERIGRLLDALVPPDRIDEWFLCGPYGMVEAASGVLTGRGVPAAAVRAELFHVAAAPPDPPAAATADAADAEVTILLDGRASNFPMGRGERVLDAALRVRPELPYACKGGVCSTCRARLVEGEVTMARNFALEPEDVAAGYVLTCQSSPVTDRLVVDYDA